MKLSRNTSILFLTVYGIVTLTGRFIIESAFNMTFIASLLSGVLLLGLLGILFRIGFLTLK